MDRIAVGMSGGVDSAVAAALLIDKGYDVEGFFMKNWDDDSEFCNAEQDYIDALQVCQNLGIPLRSINFEKEYWERVFKHFLNEHKKGRTPNPDILCNTEIKFKEFLNYTIDLGVDKIATGHYVRIKTKKKRVQLLKGADISKDQSYFLHGLNQHQISKAVFPIGSLFKTDVRKLAKKIGLDNYNKKDSVGICFIGKRNIKQFLKKYLQNQSGDIINASGEKLGEHDGVMFYTIGQRKGLGIGAKKNNSNGAWYVIDKDLKNNQLIVAQGHDHPALYKKNITASQVHWISGIAPKKNNLNAKIRYRSNDTPCSVTEIDVDKISIIFETPCFAIAPGQSIVFYDNDICLGGAVID